MTFHKRMKKSLFDPISPPDGVIEVQGELRTLARGALVSTAGSFSGAFFGAASQILIARTLGPHSYGLYAIGLVLLGILSPYTNFGLGRTAIAFGARFWKEDAARLSRVLRFTMQWSALISILLSLPLFVFAQPVAVVILKDPQAIPTLRVFALILPIQAMLGIGNSITLITRKAEYSVWSDDLLQPITNLVLLAVFIGLGWGYQGVLAAAVLSFSAGMALSLWYAWRLFPEIRLSPPASQPTAKELLFFSSATLLPVIFISLITYGDRLVLGALLPAAAVGVYQSAVQFSGFFALILGSVSAVFSPMIVSLHKQGQTPKLNDLYKVTTKWAFYLALPVAMVTLLVPRLVLTVFFGAQFAGAAQALQILTIGQLVNVGTGVVGMALIMTGHARAWSVSTFLALLASVGLNILLTPRIGIAGTAISTAAAMLVMFGIGIFQVKHSLHIWPYDRRYAKGLIAAAGSALVVSGLSRLSMPSSLLALVLVSFSALTVFILLLLLLKLDAEDRDVLRAVSLKLFGR